LAWFQFVLTSICPCFSQSPGKCQDGALKWAMTAFFQIITYSLFTLISVDAVKSTVKSAAVEALLNNLRTDQSHRSSKFISFSICEWKILLHTEVMPVHMMTNLQNY
jgi:hypothetical protein